MIEDDQSCADTTKELLEADGEFSVFVACTLKEGLSILTDYEDNYDVVLLDLVLPNGRGLAVFNQTSSCTQLPIVVISGYEDKAMECVKAGAQDYLIKPADGILLKRTLMHSIERYKFHKKYQHLVETTHAGLYTVDCRTQKFLYANDVFCEFTGYTENELRDLHQYDILTEESLPIYISRLDKLKNGDEVNPVEEFKIKTKNGRNKWIMINATFHKHDEILKHMKVICFDITEKKYKEREIESIYRTAPVGIGTLIYDNGRRTITQVNDRLCSMLGYTKNEIIGQSARILYENNEEFLRIGREKYRKIKETGIGTVRTKWKRKDGVLLDILLSSAVFDESDPNTDVTFTALDMTEKVNQEKVLEAELERRIEDWKSTFFASNVKELDKVMENV